MEVTNALKRNIMLLETFHGDGYAPQLQEGNDDLTAMSLSVHTLLILNSESQESLCNAVKTAFETAYLMGRHDAKEVPMPDEFKEAGYE